MLRESVFCDQIAEMAMEHEHTHETLEDARQSSTALLETCVCLLVWQDALAIFATNERQYVAHYGMLTYRPGLV
jgi:hypothetical protein